jgi:hypothetical protein
MFLVYALLWAAVVWYLTATLCIALRSGKVFVISTFMWAERDDNPAFFWQGIIHISGLLLILVGTPIGVAIIFSVAFLRQISI